MATPIQTSRFFILPPFEAAYIMTQIPSGDK
jgi:hypothetical protein